jgi:hypothetical protein
MCQKLVVIYSEGPNTVKSSLYATISVYVSDLSESGFVNCPTKGNHLVDQDSHPFTFSFIQEWIDLQNLLVLKYYFWNSRERCLFIYGIMKLTVTKRYVYYLCFIFWLYLCVCVFLQF